MEERETKRRKIIENIKFELIKELKIIPEILNIIITKLIKQSDIHLFASTSKENKRLIEELNNNHFYWQLLILRDFYDLPWCINNLENPIPYFMVINPFIKETNEKARKLILYKNCYLWYRVFFYFVRTCVDLKTYLMPDDKFNKMNENNYTEYEEEIETDTITYNFTNISYNSYPVRTVTSYLDKYIDTSENNIRNIIHFNNNNSSSSQKRLKFTKLAPLYCFNETIYENINEPIKFKDEKEIPSLLVCIKQSRPNVFSVRDAFIEYDFNTRSDRPTFLFDKEIKYYFDIQSNNKKELLQKVLDKLGPDIEEYNKTQYKIDLSESLEQIEQKQFILKSLKDVRVDTAVSKINQFKILEELFGKKASLNQEKTILQEGQNTILTDFNEIDPYSCFYPLSHILQADTCYSTNNRLGLSKLKKEIKVFTFITLTTTLSKYLETKVDNPSENPFLKENNPILKKYFLNKFEEFDSFFHETLTRVITDQYKIMDEYPELIFLTFLDHSIWTFVEDFLLLIINGRITSIVRYEDWEKKRILEEGFKQDRIYTKGFSFFILLFSFYLSKELNMFNLYNIKEEDTHFIKISLEHIIFAYALPEEKDHLSNIINCLQKIMSKEPKIEIHEEGLELGETISKTFFGSSLI